MVPLMFRTILVNGVTATRAVSECHHMGHNIPMVVAQGFTLLEGLKHRRSSAF